MPVFVTLSTDGVRLGFRLGGFDFDVSTGGPIFCTGEVGNDWIDDEKLVFRPNTGRFPKEVEVSALADSLRGPGFTGDRRLVSDWLSWRAISIAVFRPLARLAEPKTVPRRVPSLLTTFTVSASRALI